MNQFVLIAVFVKIALEIKKELSIAFYPDSYLFMCFAIAQVYLRSADSRVCEGHLQNEWMIKPFRKLQQVANLSALSPVFRTCVT